MRSVLLVLMIFFNQGAFSEESSRKAAKKDNENRFQVSLGQSEKWKHLTYNKIPKHEVVHKNSELLLKVRSSSGPNIYPFEGLKKIDAIFVEGSIDRLLTLNEDGVQGDKKNDDFVLRVGLVVPGDKTLNWAQRQIAAKWVLELHSLAPPGQGLSHIQFFNAVQSGDLIGQSREHPLSSLIKESFVWKIAEPGRFALQFDLPQPLTVAALWLAVDGDDTKSDFDLKLTQLEFRIKDQENP